MSESEQILIDLLDDPSFTRWIKGKANPTEQEKWNEWLAKDQLHQEVKEKAHQLYDLPYEEVDGKDVRYELNQLQNRLEGRWKKLGVPQSRHGTGGYRWAVAATIVLLLAVVTVITLYSNPQQPRETETKPLYSTIEVGYGERGALKISDGSTIRLNANSTLRYNPEQFNRSRVEVWLEGEAYFSIIRNPAGEKRNFIVHTPDGDIRILGTRFNVNTRSNHTNVVLEEGSIEVSLHDSAEGVTGQFTMKPGQRAQFSSSETDFQVQKVDTSIYTAWLEGKLVFKNSPLKDIIENIEQTYGVKIEVNSEELLKEEISGSVRNPDLATLLDGLEEVLNLSISEEKEDYYLMKANRKGSRTDSNNNQQ